MVSRWYANPPWLWEQVETAVAALEVGRGRPHRLVEVMARPQTVREDWTTS